MVLDLLGALTGLAHNLALLLSLTLLYGVVGPYAARAPSALRPLLLGALFGLIAIGAMHSPIVVAPGVIADARVVPVLLAGPFAGPAASVVAALMAAAYRLWLGGAGGIAGMGTVLTAGALGAVLAVRWRHREAPLRPLTFLLLGLVLDAVVLAWALALPDSALARRVVGAAGLPVGLFLPLGTVVLGMLLVNERRRHDERERLILAQSSLEHAAEALLWVDAEGRVVYANAACERLTGYPRSELRRRRIWEIDVTAAGRSWPALWAELRRAGQQTSERRYRRRDGRTFPVETSSGLIEHEGRAWITVLARDISERRRAEQERAALLAQEQALRVRAEETSALKDQFLATLSHELRTPLTSILGYASLLRAGILQGPAAARALEVIDRNARAQARLVDDLLDLSTLVLRTVEIDRHPVDLAAIARTEVDGIRPEAEERELSLAIPDQAPPPVPGDADRLRQVVRHLLSNALEFTAAGDRIDVAVETGNGEVRLVVADTGSGIDPAFLPHVFDRFRQADSSITRVHGGLGVGLAIVRHLVELHGGRVSAQSAGEGRGATFEVALPLGRPGTRAGAAEALPALDGVRVLVVEDEQETRDLVTSVLAERGAEVTAAASAAQALSEVQRVKPDVVLGDLAMPGGEGYELIRRLRSLGPERGGRIPAAALTARARHEDAERARAAGFEAHVLKPVEPGELVRVIAHLSRRRAA